MITRTKLYNIHEAAAELGVNADTVRRWIRNGKLSAYQIGRPYMISGVQLLQCLEQHEKRQTGQDRPSHMPSS